ncbi:GapR family DNA-binding domain-containing protein, partial [Acinetobacter nosocomialis]
MSEQAIGNNSKEQLRSIVERIENFEAEIKGLQQDKGDIYA